MIGAAVNVSTEILRSGAIGMFAMFFIVILILLYIIHQQNKQMVNLSQQILTLSREHSVAFFAAQDTTDKIIATNAQASFELTKKIAEQSKNSEKHAQILSEVKEVLSKLLYKNI